MGSLGPSWRTVLHPDNNDNSNHINFVGDRRFVYFFSNSGRDGGGDHLRTYITWIPSLHTNFFFFDL